MISLMTVYAAWFTVWYGKFMVQDFKFLVSLSVTQMPVVTIPSYQGCALMASGHKADPVLNHCWSTMHTWCISSSQITTDYHSEDRVENRSNPEGIGIAAILTRVSQSEYPRQWLLIVLKYLICFRCWSEKDKSTGFIGTV